MCRDEVIYFLCFLSSFQSTLPKGSSFEDEKKPLITVRGGYISKYSGSGSGGGSIHGHERSGDTSREEEKEVNQNGRYTPVNNSEVRPRRAWQLPHKDYDVRMR